VCGCMCVDSSEDRLMSLLSTITDVYGCVGVGACVWVCRCRYAYVGGCVCMCVWVYVCR